MIGQPSVNDLASMFMGNPGPLQAKVNQEMQGQPPGTLPEDLHDLLALQIVTNEQDAAKRNAAMQQLQQMGTQGPQGEPPTVAQSLQQQAKQKLQAQMVQQMRQQQGLQGLMQQMPPGAIPEQTPQPERQPEAQGLDQLKANIGENYAGGGIIAFATGNQVKSDDEESLSSEEAKDILERMRERTAPREEVSDLPAIKKALAFAAGLPAAAADIATLPVNILRRLVRNPMDESPKASLTPVSDIRREYLDMDKEPQVPQAAPRAEPTRAPEQPRVVSQVPGGPELPQGIVGARRYPPPPSARMEPPVQEKTVVQAKPPVQPPAPAAPQGILTPEEASLVKQTQLDRLRLNPYERARMERERYEREVGAPDTASLQSLADEIAARRQMLRSRADPLLDYLRGVAMAPRGEKWMQSGVRGGMYADEVRAAREAQDMELMQKMLETQAKISDVKRGWKKDLFTIDKAEFDKVYKDNYEAALALGKKDDEAKKMAQEAVLEREKMANALKVAGAYTDVERQKLLDRRRAEDAYKRANPKATDYEAYMAVTSPTGYLAEDKQLLAELSRLAAVLKDQADIAKNPDEASRAEAARQLGLVTAKIGSMSGVNLGGASAPPPGAVRLKQ